MKELITEVQKDIKNFESELEINNSKIDEKSRINKQKLNDVKDLCQRLNLVLSEKAQTQQLYELKREERQNALLDKKDIVNINNDIRQIREELEIKEDEVISIQNKIQIINHEIADFKNEIESLNGQNNLLKDKIESFKVFLDWHDITPKFADVISRFLAIHNKGHLIMNYDDFRKFKEIEWILPYIYPKGKEPEFRKDTDAPGFFMLNRNCYFRQKRNF